MVMRILLIVALPFALAGCAVATAPAPAPPMESRHVDAVAVERRPLPDSRTPAAAPAAQLAIVVPPNTLYVCVVDTGEVRTQTAIEFAPKVGELCAKHPEMSPCQYERNACRRSAGRIYSANGIEITMATEADYDRRVMRVKFKGG
jgi:hypothetical protein